MKLPITSWKRTLNKLGYKVRYGVTRRPRQPQPDRFGWNIEALEPRMMLTGLVNFDSATYTFSVAADLPYLGNAGTVHASGTGVTYSAIGDPWPFAINATTGAISLSASEALDLGESFALTLHATNGTDSDDAPVTVNVTTQTNADPNFNATSYSFNVPLNTPVENWVGTIAATDPESNPLDYWIDWAGPVAINPATGSLYIYSMTGYTVGSTISFNAHVADAQGMDTVPVTLNFVAATEDPIIPRKDNFNGGGGGGGGGGGAGSFRSGPYSGPQALEGDPTVTGAASLYEAQTYVLSLNKNAKTVNRWEVDWGDGTSPQIFAGAETVATHVYRDGYEARRIQVYAWVAGTSAGGYEGLSHGFWKAPPHKKDWATGLSWTTLYESIFGAQALVPDNLTFIDALRAQAPQYNNNGPLAALLRESVAAYLNAKKAPGVNYFYTFSQVVSMTQAAFANGSAAAMESTKNLFEIQNTKGGTLTTSNGTEYMLALTKDIVVNNVPPTLQIWGPATVNEAQSFQLSLSSDDPGQDTIQYWTINWGDGSPQTVSGDPSAVWHTYANGVNDYTITSTATDEDGTFSSNSWAIHVADVAPTVSISGPASLNEGSSYTLTLNYSDPGSEVPTLWWVSWGDGTSDFYNYLGTVQTIGHVYADGNANVSINAAINNGEGSFSTNSVAVTVNNVAPTVSINGSASGAIFVPYTLNLVSGYDPGADTIDHWEITWGDGSAIQTVPGNPSSTTHTYSAVGSYTISGKAFDEDGNYIAVPLIVSIGLPVGSVHLIENSDFVAQHTYNFTVPVGPDAVSMTFWGLQFDTQSLGRMNDAFEIALVQPGTQTNMAAPIFQRRDSVFNLSEGETVELGGGTYYNVLTSVVTIDITHLADGASYQLLARLVNNDTDTQTNVWVFPDLTFVDWGAGVQISNVVPPGYQHPRQTSPIDFAHLTNVTPSLAVDYHTTSFAEGSDRLFADLIVQNINKQILRGPFVVVIRNLRPLDPAVDSIARVSPQFIDGRTPQGDWYIDLSHLLPADDRLVPDAELGPLTLEFANPDHAQFVYDLDFYAYQNLAPDFVTEPSREAKPGNPFVYDSHAIDPESDLLKYRLVYGPLGMEVHIDTGEVTWTPGSNQMGTHTVRINATDPYGGKDQQQFTIDVRDSAVNRPPRFVTSPNVDAYVGLQYLYDSNAFDPDYDTLSYSVVSGPPGLVILDSTAGVVTWTPAQSQLNQYFDVTIRVSDNYAPNAGVDLQSFRIYVHPQLENNPPVITTEPSTDFDLVGESHPASSNVSPTAIDLELGPGDTETRTVSINLANAKIDLAVLYDTSGSMYGAFNTDAVLPDIRARVGELQQMGLDIGFAWSRALDFRDQLPTDPWDPIEYDLDRPYILNQPILSALGLNSTEFVNAFQAAIDRRPAGEGGPEGAESIMQALFHLATGLGFDGNGDSIFGNSPAGSWTAQLASDGSGDVPEFSSVYPPDPNNPPPSWATIGSGSLGGIGFREGAIPVVLVVTDHGTRYRTNEPTNGNGNILGVDGIELPLSSFTNDGSQSAPSNATFIQPTIDALNALGAFVVGLGAGAHLAVDTEGGFYAYQYNSVARTFLEALSRATGSINATSTPILSDNSLLDSYIQQNEPLYYELGYWPDNPNTQPNEEQRLFFTDVIKSSINAVLNNTLFDVEVVATDLDTGLVQVLTGPLQFNNGTLSFDVEFTGDGEVHNFDLQFRRVGTNLVLGHLPVTINYGYQYDVDAIDPDGDVVTLELLEAPAGVTFEPTSGYIQWKPNAAGQYSFAVRATDGRGGEDIQRWTVVVDDPVANNTPPVISTSGPIYGKTNRTVELQIDASDADGGSLRYYLVNTMNYPVPPGMSIDGSTGLITWTPSGVQYGTYIVEVMVADGQGGSTSALIDFIISSELVNQNTAPSITSNPFTEGVAGHRYRYQVTATDVQNDVLRFELVTGPAGMVVDPQTGVLAWNPSDPDVGTHPVYVKVYDSKGLKTEQIFDLRVRFPNENPVFVSDPVYGVNPVGTILAGSPWYYDLIATDSDGDDVTFRLSANAIALGMSINANNRILWTPAANQAGDHVIEVFAEDPRGGTESQQIRISVRTSLTGVNLPATITSTPPSAPAVVNQVFSYDITTSDPNNEAVWVTLDGQAVAQGASISRTETGWRVNWVPFIAGQYEMTVTAADIRGAGSQQSFVVSVLDEPVATQTNNNWPAFLADPAGPAVKDLAYTYQASAFDIDGNTLTYSLIPLIVAGTWNPTFDTATGRFEWTPDQAGAFQFKISATDGTHTTDQIVSLVVLPNAPPRITSAPVLSVETDESYVYNVVAVDPNPGSELTYYLDQKPSGMAINAATGAISWSSPTLGTHSIAVRVSDGLGGEATQTFGLRVFDPAGTGVGNQAPSILSGFPTQWQAGRLLVHQIFASDPNGDPLAFELINAPAGMTIDNQGVVRWEPTNGQISQTPYQFSVRVSDDRGGSDQDPFSILVQPQYFNFAPEFDSVPPSRAVANTLFSYDANAVDGDGDPLTYELVSGPTGMSIDPRTGLVQWTPAPSDFGNHSIRLRVRDPHGASADQVFILTVVQNAPPIIQSSPIETGIVGTQYVYDVVASDPEGQSLTFGGLHLYDSVGTEITGSGIQFVGSSIRWTPASNGTFRIAFVVTDSFGAFDTQEYYVGVSNPGTGGGPNQNPYFTSSPQLWAIANQVYTYTATGTDPEGQPVSFELVQETTSAAVNFSNGVLTWTPPATEEGNLIYFGVKILDNANPAGYRTQFFSVRVYPANVAPWVNAIPAQLVTLGQNLAVDVVAGDDDGNEITFALDAASVTRGITIDEQGRIRWTPMSADAFNVTVTVTDTFGGMTQRTFGVTVVADTIAPIVDLGYSPNTPYAGDDLVILVMAADNVGIADRTLKLVSVTKPDSSVVTYNQWLMLDSLGRTHLTLATDHIGTLNFEATATDVNGLATTINRTKIVLDPSVTSKPTVRLHSPYNTQRIEEPIDVMATIDDNVAGVDQISSWTFEVTSRLTGEIVYTATGTDEKFNAFLTKFDPTLLPNGLYNISLSATNTGGHSASASAQVTVDGNLKSGDFVVGFTDLEIPVRGLPITITRTYDSKSSSGSGDFGYGWRLDIDSTKLQVIYAPTSQSGLYGYPTFTDGTRVVITLPDGSVAGYTFVPEREGSLGTSFLPKFIADPGVRHKLVVDEISLIKLGDRYIDVQNQHDYNPADPVFGNAYELRLRNGSKFLINATDGLTSEIIDREGNTLTFTGQGIISSAGRSVLFERDFANRIVAIVAPDGSRVEYRYDSDGNLAGVKDRANQGTSFETTFAYRQDGATATHYLDTITDPLGRQPVVTEYYGGNDFSISGQFGLSNRIKRITDASGKSIDFQYELSANGLERLRSRTTFEYLNDAETLAIRRFEQYDANGNVIIEIQGKFQLVSGTWESITSEPPSTTLRTFDSKSNLLSETIVVGQIDDEINLEQDDLTTQYVYTKHDDVARTIDPRGNQTYNSYDEFGQLWSSADIFGVGTGNFYNSQGQLLRTFTATTEANFFYHPATGDIQWIEDENETVLVTIGNNDYGDVTTSVDANGNETYFEYDENGNQTATYQIVEADLDGNGTNETYEIRNETTFDEAGQVIGTSRKRYVVVGANKTLLSEETSSSNDKNALGQDNTTLDSTDLLTGYIYDIRGQVIETRRQTTEVVAAGTVWLVSRTVFDNNGRSIVSTDEYRVAIAANGTRTQLTPIADITGSRSSYDGHDRVTLAERIRGFEIVFTGAGNLQSSQFSAGPTFAVVSSSQSVYDNAGRVTESTDQYGLKTFYVYNQFGETIQTRRQSRDEFGVIVEISSETVFDSFGRAVLTTDSHLAGAVVFGTMTLFDSLNRAHQTLRLKGVIVSVAGNNSVIISEGETLWSTQTIFDAKGRVASSIDAQGGLTSFGYDYLGRKTSTVGPVVIIGGSLFRHRTETTYDSRGRVATETVGISVAVHYDASGNLVTDSTSSASAKKTEFSYDERGNVIRTVVREVSNPSIALATYVQFDSRGRKIAESEATTLLTGVTYSAADESFKSGSTLIPTRTFEYSNQGQLVAVELPAVANPANGNALARPRYEYGYDGRGNQTLVRDPLGRETRWTFNELGQEATRTLPLGFGADGILSTGESPNGTFVESFQYDVEGRQVLHVSFEGVYSQNVYDPLTGRMSQLRIFENAAAYNNGSGTPNQVWSYTHDALGRVISKTLTEGFATVRTETTSYTDEGLVDTVSGPEGIVHYDYDAFGRQTSVSSYGAGFVPQNADDYENVTQYSYDELGRLSVVMATERNNVMVDVDAVASGLQPDETKYQFDLRGNLDTIRYSNKVVHDYSYDKFDRLDFVRQFKDVVADGIYDSGVDQLLAKFDYVVGASGRRTSATERFFDSGGSLIQLNEFVWTYDAAGRLVGESLDSSVNSLDFVDSFVYDLVGNRLSTSRNWGDLAKDDYSVTSTLDVNDRILTEVKDFVGTTADESTVYTFNGTQQSQKTTSVGGLATSRQIFSYDLFGRLEKVRQETLNAGGQPIAIEETITEYDSSGTRVSSTHRVDSTNDGFFETEIKTEYLVDQSNPTGYSQVIMETQFDGAGNPLKRIVYTIGHDQISQTVYGPQGQGWDAGTTQYFGTDGHGSVRVLFDILAAIVTSAQSVQQIFHFDAYGNLLNMSAASALTSYLYSGESFDAKTQLQYLRARFYDPASGRFVGLDSFGGNKSDPQSLHKYLYVHGDPIGGIDPSGRFDSRVQISVGNALSLLARMGLLVGRAVLPFLKFAGMSASIYASQLLKQQIRSIPPSQLAQAKEYAVLAEAGYGNGDFIGLAASVGWTFRETLFENRPLGYLAQVFTKGGHVVISFAGTAFTFGDWFNNFAQGFGLEAPQYEQAFDDVEKAMNDYPGIHHFVGHSLGGGIASAAALIYRKHATTFNAAGVHSSTVARRGASLADAKVLIDAYRVKGEILSTLQNVSGLWSLGLLPFTLFSPAFGIASLVMGTVGYVMPDGVGEDFWLPAGNKDPISLHFMESVMLGLESLGTWGR